MPIHLPVFLITVWLLAMLPGVGQALMIRQTLEGGLRTARAGIAGNATGLLIWSSVAAAGLSAVLLADPRVYAAVRIVGGVVLVFLGVSTLRTPRTAARSADRTTGRTAGRTVDRTADPADPIHGRTDPPLESTDDRAHRKSWWNAYTAGLATNLGNPKAGVFAISVLPQFVTSRGPVLLSTLALGAVWALVTVSWYLLFTWVVARGRALMSKPAVHRALRLVTGVVLLVLGVAVASGV